MAEPISRINRRTAIAALAGGGAAAVAMAAPSLSPSGSLTTFQQAFTSPYATLDRAEHTVWSAEIGSTLQIENGPGLRIASVETGAPYGPQSGLIRSRSFLVNFDIVGRGSVSSDRIYRVSHRKYGSFDLYVRTAAQVQSFAQASFS